MPKLTVPVGTTSLLVRIEIQDPTGAAVTTLAFDTSGLKMAYSRDDQGNTAAAIVTPVTTTRGTWTSADATHAGFKEKDATNSPGTYELSIPNAALATGSKAVNFKVWSNAGGFQPVNLEIELVAVDLRNATNMGVTNLGDIYLAEINVDYGTTDQYTVTWLKNGVRVTSGITVPTVQVIKRSDGTNLIAATAMTQIGTTGSYKYDEASAVMVSDTPYIVVAVATIDGSSRSFPRVVSKDITP